MILGEVSKITKPKIPLHYVIEEYFLTISRFLEDMPSGETFIAFAFIIRIVTAIGSASTQVAILSVMSITFKENMSTVFVRIRLFC